jgi:hypothetical protein
MTPNQYADGEPATERIIVLQLLRNDRSEWVVPRGNAAQTARHRPQRGAGSLAHLERLGLLDRRGARFKASDGLRYIDDTLDLIATRSCLRWGSQVPPVSSALVSPQASLRAAHLRASRSDTYVGLWLRSSAQK